MSAHCCNNVVEVGENKKFKYALWIALILNFGMFLLENIQGILSNSLSLRADAIDFLGDSINYAISLFVISSSLQLKSKASMLKALSMLLFGIWIIGEAIMRFYSDFVPNSFTMSWVGGLALAVNVLVAVILYKFKDGDSNMQSVWLCSRNDAIGNVAVVIASIGVYFLNSKFPDLIVAVLMSWLAISASIKIFKVASKELKLTKESCNLTSPID